MEIPDAHKSLNRFYDEHVRLGEDLRAKLAGYRDACLGRLTAGLKSLGEEAEFVLPSFQRSVGQGSYSMHTLNQHKNDEYDIDVAVIFKKEDLPEDPAKARKRVAAALLKAGGNFKRPPEARTNAVTVWYADGAHVDIPVYREVQGFWDSSPRLEHAGSTWAARDPVAITNWFAKQVEDRSPDFPMITTVADGQLRRVVRWVKAFARSRLDWELPGGMILTILVVETYCKDRNRDDVALYRTLHALKSRLETKLEVLNPIDNVSLSARPKVKASMPILVEHLTKALADLAVLESTECTQERALLAWGRLFNHPFWDTAAKEAVVG